MLNFQFKMWMKVILDLVDQQDTTIQDGLKSSLRKNLPRLSNPDEVAVVIVSLIQGGVLTGDVNDTVIRCNSTFFRY